jgi:hypothetical protein
MVQTVFNYKEEIFQCLESMKISKLQVIQADALKIQIAIDGFEKAIRYFRNDLPSVSDNSQETLKMTEPSLVKVSRAATGSVII